MRSIKTLAQAAVLVLAGTFGLGAANPAQAAYSDTALYSWYSQSYDSEASWYSTMSNYYGGYYLYDYYAYAKAYSANANAYYAYLYAPVGSYAEYFAYWAWYYASYQEVYAYYQYLYGVYESELAYYDWYNDYYRGLAALYAAYRS